MGKVTWGNGISGSDLDDADRSQFKPYDGPPVPNGLYAFRIKMLKKGKSSGGHPQMIVGLELVPRKGREREKAYAGFFVTDYIIVTDASLFRVAPFLDAIGVSGSDFASRTTDTGEADSKGSTPIARIGKWTNDGKKYILATIKDETISKGPRTGEVIKAVANYWPPSDAAKPDPKGKGRDEDEEDEDDEEEEDEEPPPPPKKAAKKSAGKAKEPVAKKAKKKPEPEPDEDDEDDADDEEDYEDEPPF